MEPQQPAAVPISFACPYLVRISAHADVPPPASGGQKCPGVPIDGMDIVWAMHAQQAFDIRPGQRLRVTRQIPRGSGALVNILEGVVVRVGQQKTGSWYAHSQDKKLWLDRVELRKDDGELVVCNLDHLSVVENLEAPPR